MDKPAGSACEKCPGRDAACVLPEPGKGRLAIVGEAPGKNEVEQGRPFIGASGQLMERLLVRNGLKRSDIHWTNAVLCDVPKSGLAKARKQCLKRLHKELEGIPIILAVGSIGIKSASNNAKANALRYRGHVLKQKNDSLVLPTIHPAYILRQPLELELLERDVERFSTIREDWQDPAERTQLKTFINPFGPIVSIDVETNTLGGTRCKLLCFAISDGATYLVIPWEKLTDFEKAVTAEEVSLLLSKRTAVTHNGPAFDHLVLERHGIHIKAWDDTLLAYHAFASHLPKRLGHVVSMYLDTPPWKEKKHETTEELYAYNARDVVYTAQAWNAMKGDLEPARSVYQIDKQCAILCRDMQRAGLAFDKRLADEMHADLKARCTEVSEKATQIVGQPVSLGNPFSYRKLFLEHLGAPVLYRSKKTQGPSFDATAMQLYLKAEDERVASVAKLALEYRRLDYISSHYLRVPIDPDGRVHPCWLNYGAVTGRWSCEKPNLGNLPRIENDCTANLGGIRALYIAPPGRKLVAFDAKQLEVRVAAYVSQDPAMMAMVESSDPHSSNAERLFGKAFLSASPPRRKALRNLAKTGGLAVNYDAGPPTVFERIEASGQLEELRAAGFNFTLAHVEAMYEALHAAYPVFFEWKRHQLSLAKQRGYVESPICHRRCWKGPRPIPAEVGNFPIQSGAADLLNTKLPRIVAALPSSAFLVASVYDSGIFECDERDAGLVAAACKALFEEPVELFGREVVFPVETSVGDRWSEL